MEQLSVPNLTQHAAKENMEHMRLLQRKKLNCAHGDYATPKPTPKGQKL